MTAPTKPGLYVAGLNVNRYVRVTCRHGKTLATLRVKKVRRGGLPNVRAQLRHDGGWRASEVFTALQLLGLPGRERSLRYARLREVDTVAKRKCTCTFRSPHLDTLKK